MSKDKLSGYENIYKIKLRSSGFRLAYEVKDLEIIVYVGKRENNKVYDIFSLTYFIKNYMIKKSLVAVVNERSSHTVPTPHGGGIALGLMYLYFIGEIFFMLYFLVQLVFLMIFTN